MSISRISSAILRARLSRAWLAIAVCCVVLIALTGLIVTTSGRAEASSCSGPLSGAEIRVVIVVDAADFGGGSSATCLVVPMGTTGSQLLARRSAELGTGSVRYGSSGLLCAIDGLPATGCGDHNAGGYDYWGYFIGRSGSWAYGNINPFTRRLSDGDIEGWRYVRGGSGSAQDPAPRITPSQSLFPALAPNLPAVGEQPAVASGNASSLVSGQGSSAGANSLSSSTTIDVAPEQTSGSPEVEPMAATTREPVVVAEVALASSRGSSSTVGRWFAIAAVFVLIAMMAGGAWMQTRGSR